MATRKVTAKAELMQACPKCGNREHFTIHAEQCAEDCCEVWAQCAKCGHRPPPGNEIEDVWGSLDDGMVQGTLEIWNETMQEAQEA